MRSVLLAAAILISGSNVGCSDASGHDDDVSTGEDQSEVEVAPVLVIAESSITSVADAVTVENQIKIPAQASVRYASLPKGTILVGARGASGSKNPDGFLRRVEAVRTEGSDVIITTRPATLTDAIVNGSLKASSNGGGSIDGELRSGRDVGMIDVDFSSATKPAFENTDEVETADGKTQYKESIKIEKGRLVARPIVDIDLQIHGGKVSRFVAKIEGQLDSSIDALTEVTALSGPASPAANAALHAQHHQVSKVIFKSKRVPLPTFSVGRIPVSTAVEFTVTLKCDLAFGGPLTAHAGVDAKSYVRLAATQQNGEWAPPVKSDFDIKPSFSINRGSEIDAHCALEADAELSAYGTSGIVMTVAPYVDFGVKRSAATDPTTGLQSKGALAWTAQAGATGSMRGRAEVFGLTTPVDRSLAEWKAPEALTGVVDQ